MSNFDYLPIYLPIKVLDAPALQDDFYLNLVDWSAQNVLAVGLGSCVYLWSATTSKAGRRGVWGVVGFGWAGSWLAGRSGFAGARCRKRKVQQHKNAATSINAP